MNTLEEIVESPWFYLANVIFDAACYYFLWREFQKGGNARWLAAAGFGINTLCLYRDWEAYQTASAGGAVPAVTKAHVAESAARFTIMHLK